MYKADDINDTAKWLNSIGCAAFVINANHEVIFWSRSCEIMTGVRSEDIIHTTEHWRGFYDHARECLADLVLDDNWQEKVKLYNHVNHAPNTPRGLTASNWCVTPAGLKFLIFEANPLIDDNGDVIGVIETLSDATSLKKLEEELQTLSQAIENCSSSVIITDPKGIIEFVNTKFCETTGYNADEAINNHIAIIRTGDANINDKIMQSINETGEWRGEVRNKKKDGSLYWDRVSLSVIHDSNGNIVHFVGVQEDITKEYEMAEKLNYEAKHDQLTSLFNRREFERRAEELLNPDDSDEHSHSLCFIDLDQFKIINDTYGHAAGDKMLKDVSKLMQKHVRRNDTLARLGGDEFAILMANCKLEHGKRVAKDILESMNQFQFKYNNKTFRIGMSIGVVTFDKHVISLSELMKQADSACYMAKHLGRNRIHIYSPNDLDIAKQNSETKMATKIQNALDENRFYLDAQKIIGLDQKSPQKDHHYELLLRMLDKHGKKVSPASFMSSAERYDMVKDIDQWVIKEAFSILQKNPSFIEHVNFLSINLSGKSLNDDKLLNLIQDKFNKTDIPPKKICFEITETAVINRLDKAIHFIDTLKKAGVLFALDDFGSGQSSYGYLKQLPVDYLKIDGMFVKDMLKDPIDCALVRSINEVGHILNIKTVAEFVENSIIQEKLAKIGVDYGQGYGINKPSSFLELVQKQGSYTEAISA